jgi:hypothetical protein
MFSSLFKKTVTSILVASLILQSSLLFHPKKADAEIVSCAARAAAAISAMLGSSVSQALVVPTGDIPNKAAFTIDASSGFGEFFATCILKPIAIRLAAAMLHNMTQSIVNWINNGFNGNPSFVTDLNSLLNDSVDEAIGDFISNDLGAGFLCTPFAFQVRIAVAQTYLPYRYRAACTLTDITRNVNGFIEGNNTGGWEHWLEVTTVPQNNVYGATILAQNELSRKILEQVGIEEKTLDWGRGFRSWQECVEWENSPSASGASFGSANGATSLGSFSSVTSQQGSGVLAGGQKFSNTAPKSAPKCKRYETRTPGSTVQSMLENSLGSDMRKLEVADDIDSILNALMNQLTLQVVNGAKGLLGAGRKSNGSFNSVNYMDAVKPTNFDPALTSAVEVGVGNLEGDANFDGLFTGEAINLSTTTIETSTTTTETESEQIFAVSFELASSSTMSDTKPLVYDLRMKSNVSSTTLRVSTYIKNPRANREPYISLQFGDIFSELVITVGQVGGVLTGHPQDLRKRSVLFERVEIREGSEYAIKYLGKKKPGIPPGTHTIETTVTNAAGNVIATKTDVLIIE